MADEPSERLDALRKRFNSEAEKPVAGPMEPDPVSGFAAYQDAYAEEMRFLSEGGSDQGGRDILRKNMRRRRS